MLADHPTCEPTLPRSAQVDAGEASAFTGEAPVPPADGLVSPRFTGEPLLEACFADRARMSIGERDTDSQHPVGKVQQALVDLGYDLGSTGANQDGVDGAYGQRTAAAVRAFKADQGLGFEPFGDVGPGTMHRLDELFPPTLPICPVDPDVILTSTSQARTDTATNAKDCNPIFPPISSKTLRIVAKSFIRTIGSRTGTLSCGPSHVDVTPAMIDLAALTDAMMGETAPSDARDGHYRMFSEARIVVTCMGDRVIGVAFGTPFVPRRSSPPLAEIDTDNGREGPLETPRLIVSGKTASTGPPARFSWAVKGRPALAAEPAFQLVCARTSRFIWHRVEGEVSCDGLTNLTFSGSHFPTHRVYVDSVLQGTISQGPFANLWIPAGSDPTLVR